MSEGSRQTKVSELSDALSSCTASLRLQAALIIGTHPDPTFADILIERCAVESDFYVRDMLTWALLRLPAAVTVPRLLAELQSPQAQARSQALHTLSKIKDPAAWDAITRTLLRDSNDDVARSAWRAAVVLVPEGQQRALAEELATQFGRGSQEVQLSLSLALVGLGEEAIEPVLKKASNSDDPQVRAHASETRRILRDPQSSSDFAVNQVKRMFAPGQ